MAASANVEVHVWFQDTLDPEAHALAGQVLSEEERLQRDRFLFPEDRRDYAAAHDLLRRSLSKHAPAQQPVAWLFEKNAFGKPHIIGDDGKPTATEFSLSHTRGFVACAISSARVGIDVERVRQKVDYEEIAKNNFSHQEVRALQALPAIARMNRVLELWTLKEAFLKATGSGLSAELDSVWFELPPSRAIRFHAPNDVESDSWKFALFTPHPEVRMAIAIESRAVPRLLLQGSEWSPRDFL
jgi:phosphopantetheinyl transferase